MKLGTFEKIKGLQPVGSMSKKIKLTKQQDVPSVRKVMDESSKKLLKGKLV